MTRLLLRFSFIALMSCLSPAQAQPKGDLSTIVMDAVGGKVAVGMIVELFDISVDPPRRIAATSTGVDGRGVLIASGPLPVGLYELRFQTADYFRRQGVVVGEPAVLDVVLMRFFLSEPTGHYHIPLICTPSGYTTYRGT